MDVRDEPERVEIELLSGADDPASPWQPEGVAGPGPSPHRGGATIWLPVVVGLAGLVVGWVLGRASVGDIDSELRTEQSIADDPPASENRSAEASAETQPAPTDAPPPRDVPMAPVTPLLGDAEPLAREIVGLPGPLSGVELEVVAFGNGRTLSRLDLTDGTLLSHEVQRHPFGRPRILVGSDWILLPSPDETPSLVVDAAGEVEQVDFGVDRRVVGVSDQERVWLSTPELGIDGAGPIEVATISGEVIGSIELPAPPVGFDPAGAFVVEDPSGWYAVQAKATGRLTTGDLIALGANTKVVRECDAELRCEIAAVARSNDDDRRVLSPSWPDRDEPPEIGLASTDSIAPDERQAIVEVRNPADRSSVQPIVGVLSLMTGDVVEVGPAQDIASASWGPDGRFVIYNRGGRITAFDTTKGESFAISDRLIGIDSFAVRPPLPRDGF